MNAFVASTILAGFALAMPLAAQAERSAERSPVAMENLPSPLVLGPNCANSIKDQTQPGVCIRASSTPTFGMLMPYPGINNIFTGPAYVGGGEDNQASGTWSTVGGGRNNIASGNYATVGGGGLGYGSYLSGNTASGHAATIGGGFGNVASGGSSTVNGGDENRATGPWSTVAGGTNNYVSSTGWVGTIAGGSNHIVTATLATIGGGEGNSASGSASTIGGGQSNIAQAQSATVAGGKNNRASGKYAAVGGGGGPPPYFFYLGNEARGDYSTIPGGHRNTAAGDFSFATGRRAKASHNGAFVWGDSIDTDKTSSIADEFNVYASGGVRLFTNSAATVGAALAPGSGTWSLLSDRESKENVAPVNAKAVLAQVVATPITTWNYKEQDDSIRHMGPMAQDFHMAFGLGVSDKLIDTVDSDGVALAAIQGLNEKLETENERLRAKQHAMQAELSALKKQVAALVASR